MTQQTPDQTRTRQKHLWLALAATILISIALRLTVPGVVLFLFGIGLIFISLVHLIVHARAIKKVPFTAARYRYLIAFSHLLFFLGFVFQIDRTDVSTYYIPILFWLPISAASSVLPDLYRISGWSFILLSLSWLLLESVPMPRKRTFRAERRMSMTF